MRTSRRRSERTARGYIQRETLHERGAGGGASLMRKEVRDIVSELGSWLPNYRGELEYPTLLFRVLASLPGGDELEDIGYEPFNIS
jgi:hypothetical protein